MLMPIFSQVLLQDGNGFLQNCLRTLGWTPPWQIFTMSSVGGCIRQAMWRVRVYGTLSLQYVATL